jgi:hypothetical protein
VRITFEGQNTRQSLAEAIRRVYRGRLLLIRVVGGLIVLGGVLLTLTGDGWFGMVYVVGGLGIALLGPPVAVKKAVDASWRLASLVTTYTVSDTGVATRSVLADGMIAWPDVTAVDRLPGQLVLRMAGHRFLAVPVGDLPEDQRDAVDAAVHSRTSGTPAPP